MKYLIFFYLLSLSQFVIAQPQICAEYSTVGTTWTQNSTDQECGDPLMQTVDHKLWTGSSCTGTLISYSNNGPVHCMVLKYHQINNNDYATIHTNKDGNLTISAINAQVNGNVIGPFDCPDFPFYGNVVIQVCSTVAFDTIKLTNTGCVTGWVMGCPEGDEFSSFADSPENVFFDIYPNPASNYFQLKSNRPLSGTMLSIINLEGKKVKEEILTTDNPTVSVQELEKGIYLIQLQSESGILTKKLVIQ